MPCCQGAFHDQRAKFVHLIYGGIHRVQKKPFDAKWNQNHPKVFSKRTFLSIECLASGRISRSKKIFSGSNYWICICRVKSLGLISKTIAQFYRVMVSNDAGWDRSSKRSAFVQWEYRVIEMKRDSHFEGKFPFRNAERCVGHFPCFE